MLKILFRRSAYIVCFALPALGGCTTFDDLTADDASGEAAASCADPAGCNARAADGKKSGTETDVDCGGGTAPACADGKRCKEASDCASQVCKSAVCQAPRPDDGAKNGDETDVDCGGSAPKCASGKACKAHADCVSDGCGYDGKCALAPSCTGHFGGDTCGTGEVGAGAKHESCCTTLTVSRPAAVGGAYALDKYLITAGRMQAFIERFNGNLRDAFKDKPAPDGVANWLEKLPTDMESAYWLLGPNADSRRGCQIDNGTRTFWVPDAVNVAQGDIPAHYSKDDLDQKVLTCVTGSIAYAFCIWDGGRLASSDEILYAWHGPDDRKFPWGDAPTPDADPDRANLSYGRYIYPQNREVQDNAAYMSAPGRMATGYGQFGHADLIGPVLNIVRDQKLGLLYTGSVEGHGYTGTISPEWGSTGNFGAYGMAGARCARPVK
jgi:hypothetical protein